MKKGFQAESASIKFESVLLDNYGVTLDWGFDEPQYISKSIDSFIKQGLNDMNSDLSNFNFVDDNYFEFSLNSNATVTYGVYKNINLNFNINLNINQENL